MLITKKKFREFDPRKVGLIGVAFLLVLLAVTLSSGKIYRSLTSETYSAAFKEAGGLRAGAEVRIGGLAVGEVQSVELDHGHVKVQFTVEEPGNLGGETGAAIKTATPLGVKVLTVLPAGGGELPADSEIPLSRTNSPYDLAQILGQLTRQTGKLDTPQLAQALDTVSAALKDTPKGLRSSLNGVNRLAQTVNSQDQALRDLLSRAETVTGVFAQRNRDLSELFDQGNRLFAELDKRRAVIRMLLRTTNTTIDQLRGLVQDNQQQIQPTLRHLEGALDLLNRDDKLLGSIIQGFNIYAGSLGESVGGGPWFYGYIPNLPPTNIAPLLPDLLKKVYR